MNMSKHLAGQWLLNSYIKTIISHSFFITVHSVTSKIFFYASGISLEESCISGLILILTNRFLNTCN